MAFESKAALDLAAMTLGALLFVRGGLRFRSWVVEDRIGIPRFSSHTETIMLWLVYSTVVSVGIVVAKQTLRHL